MIDFNAEFEKHLRAWKKARLSGDETEDVIEELELEEYARWLHMPLDILEGRTVEDYFADIQDANEAVKLLAATIMGGLGSPEPLDNRLIEMKEAVYPLFVYILETLDEGDEHGIGHLKIKIMSLITEMDMPHPFSLYIGWIAKSKEQSELTEEAAELLSQAPAEQKIPLLQSFLHAQSEYAADCFIDILSNFPGDPYIVELTIEEFVNTRTKKAFYANCLGKLGDDSALTSLYEALEDREMGYFDYTAVKHAIEELGGSLDIERDFEGDDDYEKLKDY
jgi:HEAT repeat protein